MADDDYGFFSEEAPKKKRTRTKRPQARDVEQPVSPDGADVEDDENYGFFADSGALEAERGAPPTPAGKPSTSPSQRPGEQRTEEPAWYEPLLSSTASFAQGAMQNWGDEALAGTVAATDYLGITKSGNSYDENQRILKEGADRVTRDYPIGHGAGQMAAGMAVSAAVPGGMLAQGLAQGALSGASEYGDSRDGGRTALAAGLGGAAGAGSAYLGGKASKLFARSPQAAQDAELLAIARASQGRPGSAPRMPSGEPVPMPEPAPRPLPSPAGAPYDPLAAQTGAMVPDVPMPSGPPRPLPTEQYPGGYDPLAMQQMATPVGPPRPMPTPGRAPPPSIAADASESELEQLLAASIAARGGGKGGGGPRLMRGSDGRFHKVDYPHELDMSPPPALARPPAEAPYGPSGGRDWTYEFDASEAAMRGPKPRVGGMPLEPLPPPEAAPGYALGGVDAPSSALPRPRVGGPANPADPVPEYALGDVPLDPSPIRAPSTPGMPEASERELQRIALQRAQNELQPSKASRGLKGAATVAMFGGHPAAALGLRGVASLASPTARQGALKSGYLVANPEAGAATRMGAEAAWELGAPAAYGGKVNAQDAEHVAYADQATMNYALSETLHSGQTGLSPKDEQAITDAVVAGNDDVIRATDFRLRQRYPAYARRVERALKSLNEEE